MKNKAMIVWLIVAASLIVVGGILFVGVMSMLKWDFKKLSTVKYEENSYDITDNYGKISVFTDTADVVFVPSENGEARVVCYESAKEKHLVRVIDGALVIERQDTRKWYDYINIGFASSKITVYIPSGEYGALLVRSSTGDVEIPADFKFAGVDISASTSNVKCLASTSGAIKIKTVTGHISLANLGASSLELEVSTGKVELNGIACDGDVKIEVDTGKTYLTDVTCKTLKTEGDTGDITMKNVIASEKLLIERGTGDVFFDGCDAAEIFVETDTGDVKGTLLSEKVFMVRSDTGRIDVPKTVSGGVCEIETDTGNVKITVN